MTLILIVDDERSLVKGLKYSPEKEGYEVATAYDGEEALAVAARMPVDLIVLDLMLPKLDGLEVCRRIRKEKNTPVIMLTAKGNDVDKIVGLEVGADDYLAKPFNVRELIARIRAVLRRAAVSRHPAAPAGASLGQEITAGQLKIDLARRQVTMAGLPVELSAKEFDLLSVLASRPGQIFTRDILLEQVWGAGYFGDPRVVDVYIRRVREKVEADPSCPAWILTKWGLGYYFEGLKQ